MRYAVEIGIKPEVTCNLHFCKSGQHSTFLSKRVIEHIPHQDLRKKSNRKISY